MKKKKMSILKNRLEIISICNNKNNIKNTCFIKKMDVLIEIKLRKNRKFH